MGLTKHAGFAVLAARIAAEGSPLMRTAHRHEFEYTPRPGYLYVRSRAISSRCNDNFDEFPAEEIKTAYRTFIGKPVFVNHHNDNHRRARGVIKDAVLHEDVNPDGSPDTWCEVLMEVDAIKFPKLAKAILAGEIDRTSMGTDVQYSVCSFCGNKASTPLEYCKHIPKMKGQRIYRTTASGEKEGVLVREICYGLGFFENSLLVEEPADPTAYFLGVDARGLGKAASKTARAWGVDEDEIPDGVDILDPDHFENVFGHPKRARSCDGANRINDTAQGICPVCGWRYSATSLVVPYHPDHHLDYLGSKTAATYDYTVSLDCGDNVAYVGSSPGQVSEGQDWNCKQHGDTKVTEVGGPGATSKGLGMDTTASRRTALAPGQADEKVIAPADVDTLRDEQCPVCGEQDSYDGEKCQVCQFIAPPGEFGDPDTAKAKETDLRQESDDAKSGDLKCDNCSATFSSTPASSKQAVVLDPDQSPVADEEQSADVASKAGDPCPSCGEGTLQPNATVDEGAVAEQATEDGFAPAGSASSEDDAGDKDAADEPDGEDGEDGDKPDFLKKKKDSKKPTAARREVRTQKEQSMRPALAALAAQQKQIKALQQGLAFVAEVAGLDKHPRITSALKTAVDENPAFGGGWDNGAPVEGAPEAPSQSTQEAATPQAKDDVESVGDTPLTDVTPAATTSLDSDGVVLPVTPAQTQDVTAPVAGTDTLGQGERGGAGTNRTETEIRTGTPSDDSAAFRDGGFLGSKDAEARTLASLRLARLQIQAGIAAGDDLDLSQLIASSDRSSESIQAEIATLDKVVTATRQQPVARNLVPQSARQATRTVPSMTGSFEAPQQEVVGSVSSDEIAFE